MAYHADDPTTFPLLFPFQGDFGGILRTVRISTYFNL
jgi:hypothetical protein